MKKTKVIILLVLLSLQLTAQVHPTVKHSDNAVYSIQWENAYAQINDLIPEVKINSTWIPASEFESIRWVRKEGQRISEPNQYEGPVELLQMICEGHPYMDRFTITFEIMESRPYLVMQASLQTSKEYTLGGVRLFSSDKENIRLPGKSKDWIIFTESAAAPHTGALLYPYMLNTSAADQGKYSKAHTGVWLSMLVNDKENYAFSFASISAELWPNNFKWDLPVEKDFNKLRLTARSSAIFEEEEIIVPAGKPIVTDAFLVGFWQHQCPTLSLLETGVIMGENIRKGKPMHCPEPGWSSWHSYGRYISENSIKNAADFMAEELSDFGWKTVQIDGGWWQTPGVYYLNEDFPKGMRYLSNYVEGKELDFGLHISPFRVSGADPVIKSNPGWILQPFGKMEIDLNDEEQITTLGMIYVDGTHPEVAPFLTGRFQQMTEGYNPSFMKWDHHYGALAEGPRYDATMTGLQAHNKVIRSIRAALPDELIVTRSMGYMLGALECYDAIRVGNDINHPGIVSESEQYANITYGKTLGSIEDKQVEKGLIRFARSVARNYYVHKSIAICDPDAFFVSPLYSEDEAKCHMTLQAIMGGLFFSGDRLESLPEERVDLLKNKEIMAVNQLGVHAIPLDLFSGADIPLVWKLEKEERLIIAVFNWLDEDVVRTFSLEDDFELAGRKYSFKELWTGESFSSKNKKLTLTQKAHSVKLLEIVSH